MIPPKKARPFVKGRKGKAKTKGKAGKKKSPRARTPIQRTMASDPGDHEYR